MRKKTKEIFNMLDIDIKNTEDLHLLRFYSSYVSIRKGQVRSVTQPYMEYCPLAAHFYKKIREEDKSEELKDIIKNIIDEKINKFGFFTKNRKLLFSNVTVPYGASEILMFAMRKKLIDAAVIVCDGVGTVIVDSPEIIQGIGARMNGLFYTSPIAAIIKDLKAYGCEVVFENAAINQVEGVEKAAKLGYKNIGVTINALMDENYEEIKKIEKAYETSVTILTICTTASSDANIRDIEKYADIVWSCASSKVREEIGKKSILQLSSKIPVFVLTQKGLDLINGYSSDGNLRNKINTEKQYIIDVNNTGEKISMGNFGAYLKEAVLPVRSKREPRLSEKYTF